MKLRTSLLAVGAAFLLMAPEAGAETKTLKGAVKGDPGSSLTIKIQRVGGSPFKVLSFAFRKVSFECFGPTPGGRVSGTVGKMKIERRANPFDPRKKADVYFSGRTQTTLDKKVSVFITGVSNPKATKTNGNFGFSFGDGCTIDETDGFAEFQAKS